MVRVCGMIWTSLLLSARVFAADAVFPYPIHEQTLENGLQVYVVPMPTPNAVAVYTWFDVGSRDEIDEGRTGFAHFFEHLAFYGTPTWPPDKREEQLLRMGAEENAWTWLDETVYHTVLPSTHLNRFLAMEADRFQHLALTADMVQKESGAVYGEFRKSQADPADALSKAVWSTAFTTHTYHHDTIGWEEDIAAMPTAFSYAQAFFSRMYRPQNATLIIAGDVQPEPGFEAVRNAGWTAWDPADVTRPEIPQEPEQLEMRSVSVDWPAETAPQLLVAYKIPPGNRNDPEVAALEMVQSLLFGSTGSLNRRLVREEALAFSVSGYRGDHVDPSLFQIQVRLKDAAHLDRTTHIIEEELERIRLGQIDPEALSRARTHMRYANLTSLETPSAVASELGWTLRRAKDSAAFDVWWQNMDALTPDSLATAAQKWFVESGKTQGVLMHSPPEPPSTPTGDQP